MAFGPNTTGAPKTGDYFLGRGAVYLSLLDAITNLPTKWRPIGNAIMFKLSIKTTRVQHYNSQSALKKADDEVATQQEMNITFEADELSADNLAAFFSGASTSYTNPAIAGFTNATLVLNANAVANTWYDIQDTSGNRAYDVATGDVVLSVTAPGTVATLTTGTDYTLDTAMGRFMLKATAITKINTGGAGNVQIVLAAAAGASPANKVKALTSAPARVALKLIPLNAKSPADRAEFQAHSVMLVGNGDVGLIEDKYSTMQFEGLLGANVQVDATSPYFTLAQMSAPRS